VCIEQRNILYLHILELVQLWLHQALAPEDVSLEEIRCRLRDLVLHMGAGWYSKDVIQLLKCALLGLRQPEEYHPEGEEVEAGVEAKCTLGFKSA